MEYDKIGEDLFKKIRGRFSDVTIGDANGMVTNEPSKARFFDFDYKGLGKVSVSISEDDGLSVIYSKDFINNEDEITKNSWYDFLKELRVFSKKRMLDFSIRDINKSNLTKRDYKFLAQRSGEEQMVESKLYGTSRVSYQKVGEARIMIKHTENINQESTTGRTQKIGKIYIESPDGERFKYPYKHLSGARAMAMHVSEGGNAYDDFGKHIVSLSEEMAKLRKFKNYMGRSAVMAESLSGYMDIVKERISTVKKTIESLQKPAYYKETFEAFNPPVLEDVPSDVAENWIDELTIKQFNEELADVFPYIYNLVKEGTKAVELGPDDLLGESDEQIDEVLPALAIPALMAAARAAVPVLTRLGANIITKGGSAAARGAGAVAKGAGTMAVKHPIATTVAGGAAYAGKKAGDAIDAVGDMAADLAGDADALIAQAGAGIEAVQDQITAAIGSSGFLKVASFAKQYALPALAVVAILYGGKKVIDWLMGKGKEPQVEELEEKSPTDMDCWDGYKKQGTKPGTGKNKGKRVNNCVPEEIALEQGFEEMMGQFAEAKECEECNCAPCECDTNEDDVQEAYIKTRKDAVEALGRLRGIGKKIETGKDTFDGNLANMYVSDVYDVYSWMDSKLGISGMNDPKLKQVLDPVMQLRGEAKKLETEPGSGENARFGNQIVNALYPLMVYIEDHMEEPKDEGNAYAKAVQDAKRDGKKKGDKIQGPDGDEITLEKDDKTPLGEFILSYYDRETGQFPKGETAVLTMVEKDYGEQFIEPAKAFIEQVQALYDDYQMRTQPQQMEVDTDFDRMKELAGLR